MFYSTVTSFDPAARQDTTSMRKLALLQLEKQRSPLAVLQITVPGFETGTFGTEIGVLF